MSRIDFIKRSGRNNYLWQYVVKQANEIDGSKLVCITDKEKTISGDKHNYESLSVYVWPDTTKKDGLPWKSCDGVMNPLLYKYDLPRINTLDKNLTTLALAYYITGDKKYYELYVKQIQYWFINDSTRMNPKFDYAQFEPGHNGNRGNYWGLIEAYPLNNVLESIRLVSRRNAKFRRGIVPKLDKWFDEFGNWWKISNLGKKESQTGNNHAIAYDELYINIAIFINDKEMLKEGRDNFVNHINEQINSETGQQMAELKRTRAYHYTAFNLTHIVDILSMLNNVGLPVNADVTNLVYKAFAYIMQYKDNKKAFPFKNITNDWDSISNSLVIENARFQNLEGRKVKVTSNYANINSIIK